MKIARKVKYLRFLKAKLIKRNTSLPKRDQPPQQKEDNVSNFTMNKSQPSCLFSVLAQRKPIKILKSQLPSYEMPLTVKVVIVNKPEKENESSLIPYSQGSKDVILSEIPTQEFIEYNDVLQLSIAQMKLDQSKTKIPQFVREYFTLKQCGIESSSIEAINLWYYKGKRLSNWHYDGHDNFLFVLKGKKILYLLPPNLIGTSESRQLNNIKSENVFSTNNNHFNPMEFKSRMAQNAKECILNQGECLFIPRGWWHYVLSEGKPNIAINVWGNSLSREIAKSEEEIMLKHLILDLSQRMSETLPQWQELAQQEKQQYRRLNFSTYFSSLLQ